MADPKLFIELKNSKRFTPINIIQDFKDFDRKKEEDVTIKDTDSSYIFNISQLDDIKKIIVETLTSCKLKIVTSEPATIEIPISGFFLYDLELIFANTITEISVSTDETSDTIIGVRIYGKTTSL